MPIGYWIAACALVFVVLAYQRASLLMWTSSFLLLLILTTKLNGLTVATLLTWLVFFALFLPLNVKIWRRRFISQPALRFYRNVMPVMSRTEREAISAGSVTWEGDLFRGNPNWQKLLSAPVAKLSAEEQAFLDGPVESLCDMINDWDITQNRADLPPNVWQFIKDQGFFAFIIPKQYGGKQFSAYAHSQILVKISGRSVTAASYYRRAQFAWVLLNCYCIMVRKNKKIIICRAWLEAKKCRVLH